MNFLYRGVHARHPARNSALAGVVIPGNIHGLVTPEQHNTEDVSFASPYTSWTTNIDVARTFAASRGAGGVLLRVVADAPASNDSWSWQHSLDLWGEDEILLRGIRIGVEVIEP